MAPQDRVRIRAGLDYRTSVRIADPEWTRLLELLFSRYPRDEWATFARLGWRATAHGMTLTIAEIDEPKVGDLDLKVGHVAIQEPYSLRIALASETHPLSVCVIHSHPEDCPPHPSLVDDDMDAYYSTYFEGFTGGRPYTSLIVSRLHGSLVLSGRVYWRGKWHHVQRFLVEGRSVKSWVDGRIQTPRSHSLERVARMASAFGDDAAQRLRQATIGVIGAGGTGSAAIEVLARAGIGHLVVVDPDHVEPSNLERLHGSYDSHARAKDPKVLVAREHVQRIDPSIEVTALIGSLPQDKVLDALMSADVVVGCTDQQHSRLALSDIAVRYLIPAIDCGVALEGKQGRVTGQIIQLVRFLAADPCALCRDMIHPQRITQELMSPEERSTRQQAANQALLNGENARQYWHDEPQLNTVGFLTTTGGALAAGYAIGLITGRFSPPFSRLQANLLAEYWDVTDFHPKRRANCACGRIRGWADQGAVDALVTAPPHWPSVVTV